LLYRLPFFPGGLSVFSAYDNSLGNFNFPDAFTFEIAQSGHYQVSVSCSFTFAPLPSVPQTVQLTLSNSPPTFFYMNGQREIVVGAQQNEAISLSQSFYFNAGDLLSVAVQCITGALPGCSVIDGFVSATRLDGQIGPTGPVGNAWTVGGNSGLGIGAQRLGTNDTFIDLFEGEASVVIGGTAVSRPNLHINGSLGVKQEVNTTTGTIPLPDWGNVSFVRDISNFSTVQLPPCSAVSADAARVMLVNSCLGATATTGLSVVPFPASGDSVVIQGIRNAGGVVLRGRNTGLFLEVPGRNTWACLTQTPSLFYRDILIPATPDPAVVTDWWLSPNAPGWSLSPLDGVFKAPNQGNYNAVLGVPQVRINVLGMNWDTATPGAGNGWQVRIYTDAQTFPAGTPSTLVSTSNYSAAGTGTSYSFAATTPLITAAGAYWVRVTNIGAGITTRRCVISITGASPGSP